MRSGLGAKGLDGYCDADWGNHSSRRSTTGVLFACNGAPILWRSKLQKTIALSTVEAEYYAASSDMAISLVLSTFPSNLYVDKLFGDASARLARGPGGG